LLDDVDCDEDEFATEADLDDSFCFIVCDASSVDEVLRFICFSVMLSFDNLASEDNAF